LFIILVRWERKLLSIDYQFGGNYSHYYHFGLEK